MGGGKRKGMDFTVIKGVPNCLRDDPSHLSSPSKSIVIFPSVIYSQDERN